MFAEALIVTEAIYDVRESHNCPQLLILTLDNNPYTWISAEDEIYFCYEIKYEVNFWMITFNSCKSGRGLQPQSALQRQIFAALCGWKAGIREEHWEGRAPEKKSAKIKRPRRINWSNTVFILSKICIEPGILCQTEVKGKVFTVFGLKVNPKCAKNNVVLLLPPRACLFPCCTCDEQPYTTHLRAEYCCSLVHTTFLLIPIVTYDTAIRY